MKKLNYLIIAILFMITFSCDEDDDDIDPVYRQYMREFVMGISEYAKSENPEFIIIPQNGNELVTENGNEDDPPFLEYLHAIDGVGREDLFYGYNHDNEASPQSETEYMMIFLDICENNGVDVLTTDYCWDKDKMDDSYMKNNNKGYISFAAPDRELDQIPSYPEKPFGLNDSDISGLSDAGNFLYLLNPEKFSSRQEMIDAMAETDYDIIILDLFYEDEELTNSDLEILKIKSNNGKRLVIAYMSIGEAEDYRFYWNDSWKVGSPSFIEKENPNWEGNYKVRYWENEWQQIIYGTDNSYLDKIINIGFDGVYLDIIDAFEYFE